MNNIDTKSFYSFSQVNHFDIESYPSYNPNNEVTMKKIVLIGLLILLSACSASEGKAMKITAEQAKQKMEESSNFVLVDVRTVEEYNDARIPGAINIPNETITNVKPQELPDLDQTIFIYCRSGNRSAQAAAKLAAIGYTKVYDFGGIIDWPYETQ